MYNRKKTFTSLILTSILCLTYGTDLSFAQYVCQPAGSALTTGSLTTSDPTQAGRIIRDGVPSSCNGKTNSLQNATAIHAKSYNFTNPTGQTACVTVDFDHTGCGTNSTEVVAYSTYNPATPSTGVIGDPGFSSTGTGSFSFRVTAGQSFTIVVHEITANTGCPSFSFRVSYNTGCRVTGFDRSNDGKADPTVFRPSTGDWYTWNSAGGRLCISSGYGYLVLRQQSHESRAKFHSNSVWSLHRHTTRRRLRWRRQDRRRGLQARHRHLVCIAFDRLDDANGKLGGVG